MMYFIKYIGHTNVHKMKRDGKDCKSIVFCEMKMYIWFHEGQGTYKKLSSKHPCPNSVN